jgi:hypothetical protein
MFSDPAKVTALAASYQAEAAAAQTKARHEQGQATTKLATVNASIGRFVTALELGTMPTDVITERLAKTGRPR